MYVNLLPERTRGGGGEGGGEGSLLKNNRRNHCYPLDLRVVVDTFCIVVYKLL